jgi:alpha-L-rhamnosidase
MKIEDLRCEYLQNPIGIDAVKPRLSWRLASQIRGETQSAYRIQVGESIRSITSGRDLVWDTGKVASSQSIHHEYSGPKVETRMRYYWRVKAWDKKGKETEWSGPAFWEMGVLDSSEWSAKWVDPEGDIDPLSFKPCPYLRKAFKLVKRPQSARVFITSHGLYELSINGQVVGDDVFQPGFTSYTDRLQYQVYDVTDLLRKGENIVGVILGDGWYRGKLDMMSHRNVYGERLALLLEMRILDQDDGQLTITSDENWKATTGPIIKSDFKDGEIYDARKEMKGWNEPGFDDSLWHPVKVADYGYKNLVGLNGPAVKRKEEFSPKILHTPNGEWVLDVGQNIAGRLRMQVKGPAGTTITLQHGETLDKEGNFTMKNLQVPEFAEKLTHADNVRQIDQYTLKGSGTEVYEPRFTFHGFRYVKVSGFPGEPKAENFKAMALHSDMRETGYFECSDSLVNRLHENIKWSLKSNSIDIPTDCPQRERSGWLGDAQVFSPTSSIMMETAGFYSKWLKDIAADQRSDGQVPAVVPDMSRHIDTGMIGLANGSSGFSDAAIILPWNIYQAYDDKRVLENQYQSMKTWVDYKVQHAKKIHWTKKVQPKFWFKVPEYYEYIWDTDFHLGEWAEPNFNPNSSVLRNKLFPQKEVATAYYAYSSYLLSEIAGILGKKSDAVHYAEISKRVKDAWQKEFISNNGKLKPDRQATYVRALAFNLLPEELQSKAAQRLVELIEQNDYHLSTGFLSTTLINHVLTRFGYVDVAYKLLLQKTRPSWLYPVIKGATTIWEMWDIIKEDGTIIMGSMNHYSPGSVGSWLYQVVAGIKLDPAFPGYSKFIVQPVPGGNLSWARASYQSLFGKISSEWKIDGGKMALKVLVPVNSTATVFLPHAGSSEITESGKALQEGKGITNINKDGKVVTLEIGSGQYQFNYNYCR